MSRSLRPVAIVVLALAACATSPLGRTQLKMVPEAEMQQMGLTAFDEIKSSKPASHDRVVVGYVTCVADHVTAALEGQWAGSEWEVVVFDDPSPNAFALPGGKIGVHTGLLQAAVSQDQLAAVIGHEVAHVMAGHGNERVSAQMARNMAMQTAAAVADPKNPWHGQALGLLGVGAEIGVILPYSRAHETEADLLGLDLMSRAGFDPAQSAELWRNMAALGGEKPPEWMSTHPADRTRIRALEARVPQATKLREAALAAGRRPRCSM